MMMGVDQMLQQYWLSGDGLLMGISWMLRHCCWEM
jgi:hypothetical protein